MQDNRYQREMRRKRELCGPLIGMLNNRVVEVEGKGFVVGLVRAIQRITELSKPEEAGLELDSRVTKFSPADVARTEQVVDGKALYSTPESAWAEREKLSRSVQGLVRRSIPEGMWPVFGESGAFEVWAGSPAANLLVEVVALSKKHLLARIRQCVICDLWFFDSPNIEYCPKHRSSKFRVAAKRARDSATMEGLSDVSLQAR